MSSALSARELTCGHHGVPVLNRISLDISAGEAVVLLGNNGSGKSTLLKTFSRELPTIGGSVEVQGRRIDTYSLSELAMAVAFVPQDEPSSFPFTVEQVVLMGRIATSKQVFDSAEDIEAGREAMRLTDCVHLARRAIGTLSGGERQRVLLARALAQGSPILLLDEPAAHLDVAHQMSFAQLVRDLTQHGKTLLVALHDLNLASMIGDHAIILANGGIAAEGPCQEILQSSAIEDTYRVRFQRFTDTKQLRLAPIEATSSDTTATKAGCRSGHPS